MAGYLVREQLWKTKDGKIVKDGDPRSAFLFATPGMVLPEKPVIEGDNAKAIEPSEDKAMRLSEDKSVKPRSKK